MKENLSKKNEIWSDPKFRENAPKLVRGVPRATQKIKKRIGPKRALGPNLGPWALLRQLGKHALAARKVLGNHNTVQIAPCQSDLHNCAWPMRFAHQS